MFIKPLNYYAASKNFLTKNWAHGKALASKFDGLVKSGLELYGNVAPIVHEASKIYGGGTALRNVDQHVQKAAGAYSGYRARAEHAGNVAERLGAAIGGY